MSCSAEAMPGAQDRLKRALQFLSILGSAVPILGQWIDQATAVQRREMSRVPYLCRQAILGQDLEKLDSDLSLLAKACDYGMQPSSFPTLSVNQ